MSVPTEPLSAADDPLSDDALTDRVRVWQRVRGHRYSIDDVSTARCAIEARPEARTHLDLGCGIGSVLLAVADRLPAVRSAGIEAQEQSFELLRRNIARNGLQERVRAFHGDLRDAELLEQLSREEQGGFDLITGTPPYKPLGTASISPDPQRAHARIELRGGVEAYLLAAARMLAVDGLFVMCAETAQAPRVRVGAAAAGLGIAQRLDVVPRENKGILFSVYAFDFDSPGDERELPPLVLRDASGARTRGSCELRAFFGMPTDPAEPSQPARQRGRRPDAPLP